MMRGPSTARSPAMQAANAPTPGTTSPSAVLGGRAGHAVSVDRRPGPLERADGGAEVARPVVEDDDCLRVTPATLDRGDQSCPWWRARRSRAGRARPRRGSARANALNWASTMWCGSRPDSTRTCRAIWAWNASVSKTCRVSEPGVVAADHDVLPAPPARRCARSRAGRTRRPRPARAPRRAARVASPKRRMPALSPSASRSAWPSTIAVSSTVWWASMWGSPSVGDGQVEQRVPGERAEHVVVEADAGRDVVSGPVPSRSTSTRTLDSLVSRSRCGPCESCSSSIVVGHHCVEGVPERCHLVGRCRSRPAASRRDRSRGSARRGRAAPARRRAGRRRSRTARSWRRCRRPSSPCARSQSTVASRSARRSSTAPSSSSAWRSAARATAWVTAERW